MGMKEKGKELLGFAPLLGAALVLLCMGISLHGYETPTYAAVTEEAKSEEAAEMPKEETEETPTGAFDLEDGVYYGTGTGFAGSIKVAVTIKDKSIIAIEIISVEADDEVFFNRAKAVIDRIIETQSTDVDVVSGATYSSNGIISAVKNALTGEEDGGKAVAVSNTRTVAVGGTTSISTIEEASAYKDGTYYGSGTGFAGTITVKVVISGGKIFSIEITDTKDGSTFIEKASQLIQNIIALQTTNVDTISGATYSSVGIIEAVRNALSQAEISGGSEPTVSSSSENANAEDSELGNIGGTIPYVEGIYYGTAEGYWGDITVAVVIQDETIKAILITESEDDEAFLTRAKAVITQVIEKQSVEEIDLVSGATYSSNGILGAIRNALLEAEKATNGTMDENDNPTGQEDFEEGSDSEEDSTGEGDNSEEDEDSAEDGNDSEEDEETPSIYLDGVYAATAFCMPDEDGDFTAYQLSLKITVKDDKIIAVSDIKGDGDSANDTYINWAANGRSKYPGVVTQILEKGNVEEIDTVSRATCSSKSIIEACQEALQSAKRKEE
ncbi:MAG: FMN-binding protein [Roseburia sp.]